MKNKNFIVWSYGGGTQSAGIAALIKLGKLPVPDAIIMADTGREVTETREYLEKVIIPNGFHVEIVPHSYSKNDLEKSGRILLPMFTKNNGKVGKMPTFCSNEWKKRPVLRYLREKYPHVTKCDMWIGISIDEAHRMKPSGLKWCRYTYPLIDMVPTSRQDCYNLVRKMGWPVPPKSRCYMCPNMTTNEWRDMKNRYPEDFKKAVILEKKIQERFDDRMFLHRSAVPLEDALEMEEQQDYLFDGCDGGFCFV